MKLAGGDLIVVGAGDDISNPQRVGMIVDEYVLLARKYVAIYSALTATAKVCAPRGGELDLERLEREYRSK